jgi:hypothetical protein
VNGVEFSKCFWPATSGVRGVERCRQEVISRLASTSSSYANNIAAKADRSEVMCLCRAQRLVGTGLIEAKLPVEGHHGKFILGSASTSLRNALLANPTAQP